MITKFKKLAIENVENFIFGKAPSPVKLKKLSIGAGKVYPEINFTLPAMLVNKETLQKTKDEYSAMIEGVCKRAISLEMSELVVEFELVPDMTECPEWGIEITTLLKNVMNKYNSQYGANFILRVTPGDIRDMQRPPLMRKGKYFEKMIECIEGCAREGADMISIESIGGKEISDEAVTMADINMTLFGMITLGCRDMEFLWKHICEICERYDVIPAGDSACGFANTAMVLADQNYIPKIFAVMVRVASVVRSLVAYEQGAKGPSKDCAYEGPYIKAITGCPISMEGKMASCAHLSHLGNISAAVCDLWSNESVQNVKLLSDFAPVVSTEQLIYDVRLMNEALKRSQDAKILQQLMISSDAPLDVQAYILSPNVVLDISREIISENNYYLMARKAVNVALEKIFQAIRENYVRIDERELSWIDRVRSQINELPDSEDKFIEKILPDIDMNKTVLSEYELR